MKRPASFAPVWPAAVVVALLLAHALSFRFAVDDAYISFRYARNLLDGHGLVFNPGDPVEGYSNLLWVLLSAGGMAAGLDPLLWARLLGFAAAAATALLLPGLALRLAAAAPPAARPAAHPAARPAGGVPPARAAWAAALLLAACGPVACWSLAGLETPLFGLLIVAAWRAALDRRPATAGVLGVLLTLTRPEGIALALAFAAWAALPPAAGRRRGLGVAIVAAGEAAQLLWRHAYYGAWLPNTFYAKTGDLAGQLRTGLPYVAAFLLFWVLPWAAVAAATGPAVRARLWRAADWRRSLLLLAVWIAYVALVGGDMLGMFRFFAPLLPLLIACGAALLVAAAPGLPPRRLVTVVTLLAVVSLASSFLPLKERRLVTAHLSLRNFGGWKLAAEGLARDLPPGSTIALSPVGYIPWRTGFVTYDILGLTDRHIAHRRMAFTQGYAGHEKHDGAYILSRRPDYLLLGNVDVTDRPRREPMRPFARELDIFQSPVFQREYVPVYLELPGGRYLNLFKRADLP
ncbi:MAG: hypothetical protein ACYDIE_14545 [Candidatus Krumholzibacteriia bacterium]